MKKVTLLIYCSALFVNVFGQMYAGKDTLYGNEWIDYSKTYYKIKVADDGIYRIPASVLLEAGLPLETIPATQYRLYRYGKQEPVYISAAETLGPQDFIEFYGEKNRDVLDRHLFDKPETELTNPWYSMFNDTTAYYLTWETQGAPLRYGLMANNLDNLPAKEAYCWYTDRQVFSSAFLKRRIGSEISYSWFNGEGFGAARAAQSKFETKLSKLYPAGPAASIGIRYTCELGQHDQQLRINDSLVASDKFNDWRILEYTVKSPLKNNTVTWRLDGNAGTSDVHFVAGHWVRYPRLFDFDNAPWAKFEIEASNNAKYLEISNVAKGEEFFILYDLDNRRRLAVAADDNVIKVNIGSSVKTRTIVVAGAGLKKIQRIQTVRFRDYRQDKNANFIILSNKTLYKDKNGVDQVRKYAEYRSSAAGGSFRVAVVDVNELYEQFSYGVRFHPLSIRNFAHYVKRNWTNPEHLFMLGKAVQYDAFRPAGAQSALADSIQFVPTCGVPSSDWVFVMDRKGLSPPILNVGRLAVTEPKEIADYLEKVREHEQGLKEESQTIEGRGWRKRILHTSGGVSTGEIQLIRTLTGNMAGVLAANNFGASVEILSKTSNDPVQSSNFAQLQALIQEGVSIWTIFGHSSPFIVDFDIGEAAAYRNRGRYPLMMVFGCFSGIATLTRKSLGEEYTLAPRSGAIAYMAATGYGFIDALNLYGQKYYELLGGALYGGSIGQIARQTIAESRNTNNAGLKALLHQVMLQGDPAIAVSSAKTPDYTIDRQSVKINPNPVPIGAGRYAIEFDVVNIGANKTGKILLKIEQELPDGKLRPLLTDSIEAPAWRRTLRYKLPEPEFNALGYNRIRIAVDNDNRVLELPAAAERNNTLTDNTGKEGLEVYFYADNTQAVYPPPFSIVSRDKVVLSAFAPYTPGQTRRFLFELDTLETFDSPILQRHTLDASGGLMRWSPGLALQNEKVYYWRVGRDSLVDGRVVWQASSFTARAGSPPGWNQSHFGQFIQNGFNLMDTVPETRAVDFIKNQTYVQVRVAWRDGGFYPGLTNGYYEGFLSDYEWSLRVGSRNGLAVMLQNPNTGRLIPNPPNGSYNPTPGTEQPMYFFETKEASQRSALINFLENQVPDQSIVCVLGLNYAYDPVGYGPQLWAADSISSGRNLFQVLEGYGAKDIRKTSGYSGAKPAYGLVFQKGNPAFEATEALVNRADSVQVIRREAPAKWYAGSLESPLIGPVKKWNSLNWARGAFDNPLEIADLQVFGINKEQKDTLLMVLKQSADVSLSAVDAALFPQLKLVYNARDTLNHTSAKLERLRVLFDPVPEGAIHPAGRLTFYKDSLQQGETLEASLAFANISETPMDSLLVRFRVENNNTAQDAYKKYRPLPAGDTLHASLSWPTRLLQGDQRLLIDVNPDNAQAEWSHSNNVYLRPFTVLRDNRNPVIDVTFDGAHVLDGDLVSAKPEIVITLKDDNRYIALSDTAAFTVLLQHPDGKVYPLSFKDPNLLFFPAMSGDLPRKNQAKIEWRPTFAVDGNYKLLVNGRDAAGNFSGAADYAVNFKVITRSSISSMLNYPNPFSTSTCFVYTMTGAETPVYFKVQIMTVSGKVVREITAAEFGPLRVGVHKSDYCWDGKDAFGDQLANGVYLYRVVAKKSDGSDFEAFENQQVDGFFKNGFGKMVLMR